MGTLADICISDYASWSCNEVVPLDDSWSIYSKKSYSVIEVNISYVTIKRPHCRTEKEVVAAATDGGTTSNRNAHRVVLCDEKDMVLQLLKKEGVGAEDHLVIRKLHTDGQYHIHALLVSAREIDMSDQQSAPHHPPSSSRPDEKARIHSHGQVEGSVATRDHEWLQPAATQI
ncbi:8211_t:CDS:2 [Paraglomus occultum]|uniref:8211_t:CDS:1 n=1 Tax=Paraglomus occultum TaxID=144539 RepID=A0A9N8ZNJ1_9GLOM|nr:8211_t:CDS:2 [Paraglomus occultum]